MIRNIFFITIVFLILGIAFYYAWFKVFCFTKSIFPNVSKKLYWFFIILLPVILIVCEIYRDKESLSIEYFFSVAGGYYVIALIYMIMLYAIMDIIRIILKRTRKFDFNSQKNIFIWVNCIIIAVIIAALIYGSYNASHPYVKRYNINTGKQCKEKKLNIVMVSDIHLGYIVGNKSLDKMVNEINKLKPDVVFLAGDTINADIEPVISQKIGKQFSNIKSKYGVYAVLGNHEYFNSNINKVINYYESCGIKVLKDNTANINDEFYVIGRDDLSITRINRGKRKSIAELIEPLDTSKPIIVLDHQPDGIKEAADNNIDLQLSGHTHAGQFFPVSAVTSLMYKDSWGYMKQKNTNLIVSCGYGTWGPHIRICSRSEIVQITLNCP